jgi:hypothetical protein
MNSAADAAFFTLASVLLLAGLWRELPLQYVATVAVVTCGIEALVQIFWIEACWWLPLIVLSSRGLSRCFLYRWHSRAYYGWWVIGLTCALSTVLAPHWSTPLMGLGMQLAAMPWLIKRRQGRDLPDWLPALVWPLLAGWLLIRQIFAFNPGVGS